MNVSKTIVSVCVLVAVCASAAQADVVFDWATVGNAGNAGNAADPLNAGSVGYEYRIAKTEVTNAQYTEFLNTVDAAGANPNLLWNTAMGLTLTGGISFDAGAANGSKYAVKTNFGNKPVNNVDFFSAMRFVNWLHNGQTAGGTESGVYTITDGFTETRAAGAQFFLPTDDEWYKAGYHQPAAQGGDSDDYWLYPTASNSIPTVATATAIGDIANPGANVANYGGGANWNGAPSGNVTTVGSAGPLSASFYGTFDQGGNVWEWNEGFVGLRFIRGGSFNSSSEMALAAASSVSPAAISAFIGFRVASPIPEPGTLALLVLVAPALLRRRRG